MRNVPPFILFVHSQEEMAILQRLYCFLKLLCFASVLSQKEMRRPYRMAQKKPQILRATTPCFCIFSIVLYTYIIYVYVHVCIRRCVFVLCPRLARSTQLIVNMQCPRSKMKKIHILQKMHKSATFAELKLCSSFHLVCKTYRLHFTGPMGRESSLHNLYDLENCLVCSKFNFTRCLFNV